MDSNSKDWSTLAQLLQAGAKFLVWLGGSAGALSLLLSVLGILVEHAYLDRFGVPRTFYEAKPAEYILSGGKFVMGLPLLASVGSVWFVKNYWWLAVAVAGVAWLIGRRRWRSAWRWLVAAGFLGLWFGLALERPDAPRVVEMYTFVTAAALLYAYFELILDEPDENPPSVKLRNKYAPRLPFFILLLTSVLTLPYLKGRYGLLREPPVVEFVGKDRAYFCDLPGESPAPPCAEEQWQMIQVGKEHTILRRFRDGEVYLVPASALNTFRIVQTEKK